MEDEHMEQPAIRSNIAFRCLCVSEILEEILRDIWFDGHFKHLKSLFAVARTCRSFYEPAMDILWHTIPDVTSAMRSMSVSIHILTKAVVSDHFS